MAKTNLRKVMALLIAAVFVGTSLPAAIPTAEAAELFADFNGEKTSLDTTVWKEDLSEFSAASAIDADGRYTLSGNINANEAISLEAQVAANEDIIRIEYDVNPNVKRNKGEVHSYLVMGGKEYRLVRMRRVSSEDGTVAASRYNIHFASRDNLPVYVDSTGASTGKWYRIAVEINKITEKVTISITDYSAETVLATEDIPFSEFFGENATDYKNSGFDALKFTAKADSSKATALNLAYRMVKVTSEPYVDVVDVNVSGNAKVGETLTATVTPANADVSYQWYRYTTGNHSGGSSPVVIDGATSSTYVVTEDDENHYIAVTATLKSDSNINDTSATNDEATFVKAYPWVVDLNETINFSTVGSTKTVAAAGIRYTRSQETNTITIDTGKDGSNAVKLSTAYGTNSNTDIRTYYQWAYLNEGIIKYTMDVKIPQVLNNTSFNLRLGSTEDSGSVSNNFVLGIEDEKYPVDEWFTIQVTLYPQTATYDYEFYLANSDVVVIAQGAEIAEKNEAFAGQIKTKGLTNARITLTAKEDAEFTEAESVIIDNIAVDVLENKINVPYIVIDEETNTATATLTADEVGAKIFLALYDSNGNIKGIYLSDAATAENKALTATSLIALPSGGSAKAFLWNSDTLVPLRAISVK